MQASVVDLRYKMNDVLKALARHEQVEVLYRGQVKGVIVNQCPKKSIKSKNHPFFGQLEKGSDVDAIVDSLRGPRYDF